MTAWVVSDLHFYHRNILKFCPGTRNKFCDLQDMEEKIIGEWNSKVKPEDIIYDLGDFCFNKKYVDLIVPRLNGKKVFIMGNHNEHFAKAFEQYGEVCWYKRIKHNGQHIVMCHYPITSWDRMFHGGFHFFGHCHGTHDTKWRSIDVGYDNLGEIMTVDSVLDMILGKPIPEYGEQL